MSESNSCDASVEIPDAARAPRGDPVGSHLVMLPSTAFDETLKPLRPPVYIGFCTMEGASRLFVIARAESRDSLGRQWGHWYSSRTPTGEFKEIPWQFDTQTKKMRADVAEKIISMLRAGKGMPEDFARTLPTAE